MPQSLHNIDRFIYGELNDLNEDPKTSVWRKLEDQLDQQEEPERKIRFFYTKRVAIVAFLVLLSFMLYESSHHSIQKQEGIADKVDDTKSDAAGELTHEASNEQESNSSNDNLVAAPSSSYSDGKEFSLADETAFRSSSDLLDNKKTATGNEATLPSQARNSDGKNVLQIQPFYGINREQPFFLLTPIISGYKPILSLNEKKPKQSSTKSEWLLSPWVAREWTNYRLEEDVPDGTTLPPAAYVLQVQSKERREPSFAGGISIERKLNKCFWLQSGISFAQSAIAIVPQKIAAERNSDGTIGYRYNTSSGYAFIKPSFAANPVIGDSLSATEAQHNLSYIQVPLTLQWKKKGKKLSLSTGAGVGLNILTKATLETEMKDVTNREIVTANRLKGMNKMYADFIVNAGVNYELNNKLGITVTPYYRTALTSINQNNVVKTYPYSAGLAIACAYKF